MPSNSPHARTNRRRCESRGVVRPALPLNGRGVVRPASPLNGRGRWRGGRILRDDGEVMCIRRRQVVGAGGYDGPARLEVKLPG